MATVAVMVPALRVRIVQNNLDLLDLARSVNNSQIDVECLKPADTLSCGPRFFDRWQSPQEPRYERIEIKFINVGISRCENSACAVASARGWRGRGASQLNFIRCSSR